MRRLKTLTSALVVALVVITCVDYAASAATGKPLILGKINKANTQTVLKRTNAGPALNLTTTSSSAAPLTTNGRGKVANLNADKVDGLDSKALRNHSYVFTKDITVSDDGFASPVPVPPGDYEFSYSAFLTGADNGWVYCEIRREHGATTTYVGISQFTAGAFRPGVTGAGVVRKAPGDSVEFECQAANPFTTEPDIPIQLVLTPTTVVGTAPLPSGESLARLAGH